MLRVSAALLGFLLYGPLLVHSLVMHVAIHYLDTTVDDKGRVYTWGSNEYNKLGLGPGTGEYESLPRLMDAFEGIEIVDVSCGDYYTAAVDSDGKMYSWGWGGSTMKGAGGLGHAGGKDEPTPRLVRSLVDQGVPIASVECGEFHTVALSKDGEIWAWGNGEYGRLGNGETDTFEVPEPIEFFADENVVSIAAGRDFTFALTDSGEFYGWGGNSRTYIVLACPACHCKVHSDCTAPIPDVIVLCRQPIGCWRWSHHGSLQHGSDSHPCGRLQRHEREAVRCGVRPRRGRDRRWTPVHVGVQVVARTPRDDGAPGREDRASRMWTHVHRRAFRGRQSVYVRQRLVELPRPRRPQEPIAATADRVARQYQRHCVRICAIYALRGWMQMDSLLLLLRSVSCGDYHMGAISTPHSEAMDKDFSFRE